MASSDAESNWDHRLLPLLGDEWTSVDVIAAKLHAKPFTVLARLKDMMRRDVIERRIVNHPTKKHDGRPVQQAQFRRAQVLR